MVGEEAGADTEEAEAKVSDVESTGWSNDAEETSAAELSMDENNDKNEGSREEGGCPTSASGSIDIPPGAHFYMVRAKSVEAVDEMRNAGHFAPTTPSVKEKIDAALKDRESQVALIVTIPGEGCR